MFLLLLPLAVVASAAATVTAGTSSVSPSAEFEQTLKARGLLAPAPSQKVVETIAPPASAEVDERVQADSKTGVELSRIKSWDETDDGNLLHVEMTTLPKNQHTVAFWVLPKGSPGCAMFGWTMYDAAGRALKSTFWRNDPALRIAGAARFPSDLYPDAVPPVAFVRVLGSMRDGATGELNQQISPYGYVGQNVRVESVQRVTVPAGTFSAFKVTTTPDVSTLMRSWPGFVLSVVNRFVPSSTYYFDCRAPYRMLKQEGTIAAGGPEVITELVRFYAAGVRAENTVVSSPSEPSRAR